MGADCYSADTENGDHIDDPSEDGLFMLLSGLDQAGNTFITIKPADNDSAWHASVTLLPSGACEVERADPARSEQHRDTVNDPDDIARDLIIWLAARHYPGRPARPVRVAAYPARPSIPARPAAYIRDRDATDIDDPDITALRDIVIRLAQDELAWPAPAVYADAGPPGSGLAALAEAITAGRHDGVFATHPSQLGDDLAQIEAFDRLCRRYGVRLLFWRHRDVTNTRALFDVIYRVKEFTVTDEHLRLLRHAHVFWDEAEFGAPSVNPKRPYGNSNVYQDIAEILDVPEGEWEDEGRDWTLDTEWRFLRLHVETAIALQIALATGEFRAGRYVRDDEMLSTNRWKRAET
jgi:hypothetical protein